MREVNYKVITSAGSCVVKTMPRAKEICAMYPGSRYEVFLTDVVEPMSEEAKALRDKRIAKRKKMKRVSKA